MNALALLVGNSNYHLKHLHLPNASNDAKALGEKLSDLGFIVETLFDADEQVFMEALSAFGRKLKKYDVGLFFFAGHGLEVKGENFLTAVDTSFIDELSAKHTSIPLDLVIEQMEDGGPDIKIIILDACRNNPLPDVFRGIKRSGLAPIYAPKGTLIAFSTSPGQVAKDNGPGGNSIYTAALLNHLGATDITIEEFFKRVRTSVYTLSNGKQTSWEHTSLIGTFGFNDSKLVHAIDLPYPSEFVADKDFISDGSDIGEIIVAMKSRDFYKQGPALQQFKSLKKDQLTPEVMFLMGRNILQAAEGDERRAKAFMGNLAYWLPPFAKNGENHLLNGMLFEMYFDSKGRFRKHKFKAAFLDKLYDLENEKDFNSSFKMIAHQLAPFKGQILYLPGQRPVAVELKLKKIEYLNFQKQPRTKYLLDCIKHEEAEIISFVPDDDTVPHNISFEDLKVKISKLVMVPQGKLTISCNYSSKEVQLVGVPLEMVWL